MKVSRGAWCEQPLLVLVLILVLAHTDGTLVSYSNLGTCRHLGTPQTEAPRLSPTQPRLMATETTCQVAQSQLIYCQAHSTF